MERLFEFWRRYMDIPKEVEDFFKQHTEIKPYEKGSLISQPDRNVEIWSFVFQGLVAGVHYPETGGRQIRWFALPNHFFTSTTHLFTKNKAEHIEVLKNSTILQIPRTVAQEGQQKYLAISEFFHILLQQRIKQYRNYIHLMQEENTKERYISFIETMPEIVAATTQEQHCQYLRMSNGSYYSAKNAYLKRPGH